MILFFCFIFLLIFVFLALLGFPFYKHHFDKVVILRSAFRKLVPAKAWKGSPANKEILRAAQDDSLRVKQGILASIFLLLIIAIILYIQWGNYQGLSEFYTLSNTSKNEGQKTFDHAQIQAVTQKFIVYLKTHSQDTKGWFLLGRLYMDQGKYQQAADAFKQSYLTDKGKIPEVMSQYAQALYLLHHQQLNAESLRLVQATLSQDSQNVTALNLLAMDAFQHHRYTLAMVYWKRLRNQYVEESPEFKTLTTAIEVCEKKCPS